MLDDRTYKNHGLKMKNPVHVLAEDSRTPNMVGWMELRFINPRT